jgi:hypothetical protein
MWVLRRGLWVWEVDRIARGANTVLGFGIRFVEFLLSNIGDLSNCMLQVSLISCGCWVQLLATHLHPSASSSTFHQL